MVKPNEPCFRSRPTWAITWLRHYECLSKNDLMVASYPCNEGGMLDMCVIGATSHEVGQALCSHIIVVMIVSLRNEIEVTNGVSTKTNC